MINPSSLFRKLEKAKFHSDLGRYEKSEVVKKLPEFIQLEPTTACNLRCITCSRGGTTPGKRHMTLEEVDGILSVFPNLKAVRLQGLGEPLLHPQIEEVLRRFKDKNVRIWFISNGTLLTSEKYRRIIVEYLSDIAISFDSTRRQNFNRIRRGADMENITAGIKMLVEDRDKKNPKLAIGINFVATHQNYAEIEELCDIATGLKLDYVSIAEVENWTIPGEKGYDESSAFVAESRKYAKQIGHAIRKLRLKLLKKGIILGYKSHAKRMGNCFWPFKSLFVTADGDVTPCCIRMHKKHVLGNIFDARSSFDELWNGRRYRDFRRSHIAKLPTNAICTNCPD